MAGRDEAPASRHDRVKQLFMQVLDEPHDKRAAYLAEACDGDEPVWREVLELLLLHQKRDPRVDEPIDPTAALQALLEPRDGQVGPYRLIRRLGQGGMGIVHLAERDGRFAAVKLLVAGALTPELRERFKLEAEILTRLHHPGIARIHDAGEAVGPGGAPQPWIAMEYVEGLPLLEFANPAHLGIDARLELLATVCDAVQHAHSQGIVHRDLKPANILVRADGRPVVLDFGVARLTGGDERPTELLTRTGQMVGTPQYMSPEQVQAKPADITPASDVYSLGVIAYEMCAGRAPYEATSMSLHRAIVTILTVEPPSLATVSSRFRGALARVVSTALEKDPRHRYADAGEFADDLRRKLAGRRVRARGPSLSRRIVGWSRRRRRVVAAISSVLIVAVVLAAWNLGQHRAVPRERILSAYRESETLVVQAIPLLYEGERTPSRMRQAIDLYSRARLLIEQVPPLSQHDVLLRGIEKDLGTAQFLLGELIWDLQPYRASAATLEHAISIGPNAAAGWRQDIQLPQLPIGEVPQRDLDGMLAAAYLGQYRLWGESNALLNAQLWVGMSRHEFLRTWGPPSPRPAGPDSLVAWASYGFLYNSLTEIQTEAARFRASPAGARSAVLYSDSAYARRAAFMQNWPALGSLLFERGRALRTYGALTGSLATLDSAARYLHECADFRGPDRPWVFAQTRQELAGLALDRARLEPDPVARAECLLRGRRDVAMALAVLRPTELPAAASASLRSLDAELLAELSLATRRPALLDEANSELREAATAFPSTALPREAALVCVRQAVLARARYVESAERRERAAAGAALDRARVLAESHSDSLMLHRCLRESQALATAAPWPR